MPVVQMAILAELLCTKVRDAALTSDDGQGAERPTLACAIVGHEIRERDRMRQGATQMASLQDRLDQFRKEFESGAPPFNATREVIETMHRATAELKESGAETRALKIGDRAPSFTLFNQDHLQVASNDLVREGPLVISFFRGHW